MGTNKKHYAQKCAFHISFSCDNSKKYSNILTIFTYFFSVRGEMFSFFLFCTKNSC